MEWINVNEYLPSMYTPVLIRIRGYKLPFIVAEMMHGTNSKNFMFSTLDPFGNEDELITDVSHWMYIMLPVEE